MAQNGPSELRNHRQFLAAKEAAAIIGIHVQTLYRWTRHPDKKRRPPMRRFGRQCLRFPVDEFMEWQKNAT